MNKNYKVIYQQKGEYIAQTEITAGFIPREGELVKFEEGANITYEVAEVLHKFGGENPQKVYIELVKIE